MRTRLISLVIIFAAFVGFTLAGAERAHAAIITVVNAADSGNGSLRQAIINANSGDTINFTPGVTGTITLTTGELVINKTLTIFGPGANVLAISGNNSSRVFHIATGIGASITGLTIQNGNATGSGFNDYGGGVFNDNASLTLNNCSFASNTAGLGGAVSNYGGSLTMNNCTLTSNSAVFGGGIFNVGNNGGTANLTLSNSTVSGNSASAHGGGAGNSGGATLTVTNCTFSGNFGSAGNTVGGGLFNEGSSATFTNGTISGNSAAGGGGIYSSGGTLTLSNTTISGNSSGGGGGFTNGGTLTLSNCTVSGNASGTSGGGLLNSNGATASLSNCTFNANRSNGSSHAGIIVNGGTLNLANTILKAGASGANLTSSGVVNSQGYNLSSDNSAGLNAAGDQTNTDPKLGPLQNNGGPTFTHALLSGSPAIDAGDPNFDPNSFNPPRVNDQRGSGFARVVNGRIDIGAVEAQRFTVTNTNDNGAGSLRQALAGTSNGDIVVFGAGLTGTIVLTSGELNVNKDATITGPGANLLSVSGNNASRVFHVTPGKTVTISGLTIQSGNAGGGYGGGIYNDHASLMVNDCTISSSSADYGGGIMNDGYLSGGAALTLTNCTVSGNVANIDGGGLYSHGQFGGATLTLNNSTVSANSTNNGSGGGILNNGIAGSAVLKLTSSTLSGNSAYEGGALFNDGSSGGSAPMVVKNCTVSGNFTFGGIAGGIYLSGQSGTATLQLSNTILNAGTPGANIVNHQGTVTSLGYNLSSDNSAGLNAAGDQTNTDPKLGPLQNNGGPTFTHPLLYGSPAIDTGDPAFDPNAFNPPLTLDQRGPSFSRVVNNRVDIGAVEAQRFTVTNINDSGAGSLRQALVSATSGDIILFGAGLTGTIVLAAGELSVNKDLTITGPGANVLSVSGNNTSRVFHVFPGKTVAIFGLTVQNGNASGQGGGGINNEHGMVTVSSCNIINNSADYGAGLFNDGFASSAAMTILNCTVSGNTATSGFGGGGIYSHGQSGSASLTVSGTTVSGNSAPNGSGGGIYNNGLSGSGSQSLTNCTVSGNSALDGGGLFNDGSNSGSAQLTVVNCTLSGNSASNGYGGGIHNYGLSGSAPLNLTNSTISGNSALNGGGIYNDGSSSGSAPLTVANCTLSGNTGASGGSIYNFGPSGSASATFTNTIVNAGSSGATIFNNQGTVTSLGYNLTSDNGGGFFTAAGDKPNTNPKLSPLENNGGPALTHALSTGSPAIDAGNPSFNPNAFNPPLNFDQRGSGFSRVVNGRVDIGAFEANPVTLTVTNSNDSGAGSLRQTLMNAGNADIIVFAPGFNATITLTSGELLVNRDITINGPGANLAVVNGNNASRVIHIAPGRSISISGLTIQGGNAGSQFGGGIYNDHSALTLDGCGVSGSSAAFGGGIYNNGSGPGSASLVVTNTTISANFATSSGGGIYNNGSNSGTAPVTLVNSTLSANAATSAGGIYNNGSNSGSAPLMLSNDTFSDSGAGGGIVNNGSSSGAAPVSLGNTLLNAGSSGTNITNIGGTITSLGYNLSSDNGGGFLTGTGDKINTNPRLSRLQGNGGTTLTHLPLAGSPAIDAGNPGFNPNAFTPPLNFDQRGSGFARVVNSRIDIGAVEAHPVTFTVTNLNDNGAGSFRQALADAGTGDAIAFAAGLTGTIAVAVPGLSVNADVTINGPGANILSVSGNNARRVIHIFPGRTVSISGLTIENGNLINVGGNGGGILNEGSSLTLTNCTVRNSSADTGQSGAGGGGGIYTDGFFGFATLTLTSCTVSGNIAGQGGGGGICNVNSSLLTMTNCTVSGNSAGAGVGGGILVAGPATLTNCTLSGNSTPSAFDGGGIHNFGSVSVGNTVFKTGSVGRNIVNVNGTIVSRGHNLSNDNANGGSGTGPGGYLNGFGDIRNTDPMLGVLQDNGGPTFTHALLSGSPAINAGNDAEAPLRDQRGYPRRGISDIGAFEFGSLERIVSITPSGNNVVISFETFSGNTYRLERTLSLTNPDWQSIPGVNDLFVTSDGVRSITDPNGLSLGKAFYRVRVLP